MISLRCAALISLLSALAFGCVEDSAALPDAAPPDAAPADATPADAAPPDAAPPDAAPADATPADATPPDAAPPCAEGVVEPCPLTDACDGTRTCAGGLFGPCTANPERCTGADDDCDGSVDEATAEACYDGPADSDGVGACRAGRRLCVDGALDAACADQVTPTRERCDDQDRDCNGVVDDAALAFDEQACPARHRCSDVEVGDLDGDGDLDIVCATAYVGMPGDAPTGLVWWLNDGAGGCGPAQYTGEVPGEQSRGLTDIALGDIDGDGDLDVVAGSPAITAQVFLNAGGRLGDPTPAFDRDDAATGLALADVTGDGALDIVTAVGFAAAWNVAVGEGRGDGTFAAPTLYGGEMPTLARHVSVADVGGDGALDIVVMTEGDVRLLRARNRGFANPVVLFATEPGQASSLLLTDVDGDGLVDLAVPSERLWRFARGDAAGFEPPVVIPHQNDLNAIIIGDFDCDPQLELLLDGADLVFVGDPPQGASSQRVVPTGFDAAAADLDGDGVDDVVLTPGAGGVRILLLRL